MSDEFTERIRGDLCLTDDVNRVSLEVVSGWLSTEAYWALGRSREAIELSVEHSYLYGVVGPRDETVACVRVVTDRATFAWVCDVFVDEARRGEGIGTWMVREVTDHWSELGVTRILLATKDAHGVYAKLGYSPLAHAERFMEIDRRPRF